MELNFNDPDVIKAIKDAGFIANSDVEGLKKKRDELLAKLSAGKATEEELEAARTKLKEIEERKLADEQNWQELEGRLRNEMQEKESLLKASNESLTNTLIERDLMSVLVANKVAPHFIEAVKAMLRSKVALEDNKAMVEGQPLGEFVKQWAESDDGKHFVAAPDNSGGGAPGSKGAKPVVRKFNEMTPAELVALRNEDPAKYNQIKDEFYAQK